MANISLDDFIKKMKELKKAPIQNFEEAIIKITYSVLWQIAKHTIIDTGQARAKVIRKFAEKYGFEYGDLEGKFLRYWEEHGYPENANRSWNNYKSTSIRNKKTNKKREIKISIQDEGLYGQAYNEGGNYPSESPYDKETGEYRDNSDFFPRHVDIIIDSINNGNYKDFEKLDCEKIANEVFIEVENYLFKK